MFGQSAEQGRQLQGAAILGPGLAFILPLTAMLTKEPEMLQPDAFCEHTMQQNATTAGSAGAYSAPPDPPAGFKGKEGDGNGGEGQGRRGRGG